MCDCDDGPTVMREVIRRARKQYRCCECGNHIEVGNRYEYVTGIWDGVGQTFRTCLDCVEARKIYVDQLDRHDCLPCFGELYEGWAPCELPLHHRRHEPRAA